MVMARRKLFRAFPRGMESMAVRARSTAASKRERSSAAAALTISSMKTVGRGLAALIITTHASTCTAATLLLRRSACRFRSQDASSLDQLLNGGLILSAGLKQINADRAPDRYQRVRRVGVELLQTGHQLESRNLTGCRGLPLSACGQAGARGVRTGSNVDLIQRVAIALRVADRPEELLGAAQLHPILAVAGRAELGCGRIGGESRHRTEQQGKSDDEFFHGHP